jgi:hypothetical protein
MREPDIELDGWCLADGEERHSEAPTDFWIPSAEERERLQPGDYAKLIFHIAVDDREAPVSVERMWVVVRERLPGTYLGVLDNDPDAIEENDELWSGIEVPFNPRHVIDIRSRTGASIKLAAQEPRRRWPPQ